MTVTKEQRINQRVAEAICRDFAWEGRRFNVGDVVALLDGRVVAVASDLDGALAALRKIDPDPQRGMLVRAAHPVTDVIR